jgi:LysR family hydrogen peroxide-inducible transcriptional activator
MQIRKIESLLGVTIFDRSRQGARVTAEGDAVVEQARAVLEEARKLHELASVSRGPLEGIYRLGVIASLGPYLIPHLLPALRQAFPRLELLMKEGLTDGLLEDLKGGLLDIVIASLTFSDDALHMKKLLREPLVLALPSGHPWSKRKSLSPSELKPADMVLLEKGHCLSNEALNLCPTRSRALPAKQFHATSLETLRHLVAAGYGYAIMPKLAIRQNDMEGLLQYRPIEGAQSHRTLIIACRKRYTRRTDVDTLAAFIRAHAPHGTERTE